MKLLTVIKVIVAIGVAATLTVITFNIGFFQTVEEGVHYGIWYGFPLGYYFNGYYIDWSAGGFPSWLPLSYWVIRNWIVDFLIWFALVGSTLILIDLGLKRILRVAEHEH